MAPKLKGEAKQAANDRLKRMLQGAFAGPPTPLKDIPTKDGGSRVSPRRKKAKKRSK
jgi:hypothetical protein